MKIFTEKFIQSVPPTNKRQYVGQGQGFTLLIQPSGVKTFLYRYSFNGKRKQLALGHHRSGTMSMHGISLAEARTRHFEAFQLVTKGIDPSASDDFSFERFANYFLERSKVKHSARRNQACKKSLEKDVIPIWGHKPISEIERNDAVDLLKRVAARAPGQAAMVSTLICAVFDTALSMGNIEVNPMLGLRKDVPELKAVAKNRWLSEAEIQTAWEALSARQGCEGATRALQIILVTGQRPSDVIQMHRRDIKGEWWVTPSNGALKRREHWIYLTPLALALIGDGDGYIFTSPAGQVLGLNVLSRLARHPLSNNGTKSAPYSGMDRWTPHDLRRTVYYHLQRLGVASDTVKAVLAHSLEGSRRFSHGRFPAEEKAALLEWEAELMSILKIELPPKVFPMRPSFGL